MGTQQRPPATISFLKLFLLLEDILTGWIQLHRKFTEWEWFTDVNTTHLFTYCLLRANHKDAKWRGIDIKRGSFITSLDTLSKQTGLSVMQVRTAINKLEKTSEITSQSTNINRLITVTNYDLYQSDNKPDNKRVTSKQQTSNKPLTTDNNDNNNNNEKNEDNEEKKGSSVFENQFEEFWNSFPVVNRTKGSMKKAEQNLKAALKKDNFNQISKGVNSYAEFIKRNGQSNADAFRWLADERWRDDYTIQFQQKTGSPQKSKHQRAREALGLDIPEQRSSEPIDITPADLF